MDQSKNIETSLTSPLDRNKDKSYLKKLSNISKKPLNDEQTKNAFDDLNDLTNVENYPKIERRYADPPISLQNFGLISFIPAKTAIPNKNGIYGFIKLRGNYATEIEANERSEFLIRNYDSYHKIYHCYVGRPTPLTTLSKFSSEISEINLRDDIKESVSDSVKKQKNKEKKEVQNIKEREKNLQKDIEREASDPYEIYTTLRVKKAQLLWTYSTTRDKLSEIKEIIEKTSKEISHLDEENKEYSEMYYDRYMRARKESGLDTGGSNSDPQSNFIQYMCDDISFKFNEDLEVINKKLKTKLTKLETENSNLKKLNQQFINKFNKKENNNK